MGGNTTLPGNVDPIQDGATAEGDRVPVKELARPRSLDTEGIVKSPIPTKVCTERTYVWARVDHGAL